MTTADSAFRPTADLKRYFAGSWAYLRLLDDRRLGQSGSILGHCVFQPDAAALIYRERGRLSFAGCESDASRSYRYAFPAAFSAAVSFADGRPFHEMALEAGESRFSHSCPPDLYEGRCRLVSPREWRLTWRVTGPRKDLCLRTAYRRFADPCGRYRSLVAGAY